MYRAYLTGRGAVDTTVEHFKGRVFSWDVVNEAMENNVPASRNCHSWHCWMKTKGWKKAAPVNWNRSSDGVTDTTYLERAFRYAAAADSQVTR